MNENKRYTLKEIDNFNYGIKVTDVIMDNDIELPQSTVCDLLNEQEELIKRLKTIREEQIETILEHKRKMQELEERNKRQYNRLKELTELMYERQWGKLENMVDEWEKQDELLQAEWRDY